MLTDKDRAELVANWRGTNADELAGLAQRGDAAGFDRALLAYVRARQTPRFFFTPGEIPARVAWIRTHLPEGLTGVLDHADAVLKHRFPPHDSGTDYNVALPEDFSWLTCATSDPQMVYALNRHRFWVELAMAYRFTGQARYVDELKRQIVTWCRDQGRPPLEEAKLGPYSSKYSAVQPRWALLDAAIRGDTWVWTYFLLHDDPLWTPEINALFLHRLWLHGKFLEILTPRDGSGGNWAIMQAQGMLNIALLFPEFAQSPEWESHALQSLTCCLDQQFRADGVHSEQSCDYYLGCISWLLEPFCLAELNGRQGVAPQIQKLRHATESFYQLLHPDGTQPALSDSCLIGCDGILTAAASVLREPKWARLDVLTPHDVWLCGPQDPRPKVADVRPAAVAFRDAGYYVMRSGDTARDRQLVFDCGPKGGWHGHFDLLSFELYGFGRSLLCDPGRLIYVENEDRKWVISTPAHNTISVDGTNHAAYADARDPAFHVDAWEVQDDHILVRAHHRGYAALAGAPVVGRTIWYDRKDTYVILDWGDGQQDHDFTVSFTFPGLDASPLRDNRICSQRTDGNVLVSALPCPGQTLAREERFWSPQYGQREPAIRYTAVQHGRQVVFGHVVRVSDGREPAVLSAVWETPPVLGEAVKIRLREGAQERIVALGACRLD